MERAYRNARVAIEPEADGFVVTIARDDTQVKWIDELPVAERKRILGSSIDAVIVARGHARVAIEERVQILWRGEGPDDLPRRGRDNGPIRAYAPQR